MKIQLKIIVDVIILIFSSLCLAANDKTKPINEDHSKTHNMRVQMNETLKAVEQGWQLTISDVNKLRSSQLNDRLVISGFPQSSTSTESITHDMTTQSIFSP